MKICQSNPETKNESITEMAMAAAVMLRLAELEGEPNATAENKNRLNLTYNTESCIMCA